MEKETYTDAAVVALSKRFVWVTVNRDRTPDLPKRFHVSAYPSLILLGAKDEKVHRFSGFKKPPVFIEQLEQGLRRYELYKQGKEWDEPLPRPATICETGTVESFVAPSEKGPSGIAFLKGQAWLAQEDELFRIDLSNGETIAKHALPRRVIDLCTDGRLLYAVEYGWTAGGPIHVIDPETGKALRTIVTEENKKNRAMGTKGIAWRDGKLYVLSGMRGMLHEVDPQTGKVTRTLESGKTWLAGLAFDGTHFVAGSRDALHFLDAETGKAVRSVKVNYPLRTVGYHEEAYYLLEQAVFGHDKQHKRVRVFPKRVLVHKLTPVR